MRKSLKVSHKPLDKREFIMKLLKGFSGIRCKKGFDGGKRTNGAKKKKVANIRMYFECKRLIILSAVLKGCGAI